MIYGMHQKIDLQRNLVIYLSAGGKPAKKLGDISARKFLPKLKPGDVVRVVNPSSFNPLFPLIRAKLVYSHWHDTGIAKGQEPDAIARALAVAAPGIFHPLNVRADLIDLRRLVTLRNALIQNKTALTNRIFAVTRKKVKEMEQDELGLGSPALVEDVRGLLKGEDLLINGLEKSINERARQVPECEQLKRAMHQDSMLSPAMVLAGLGDPARFPSVSALWHYCGFHVVDGHAPKHQKGQLSDFKSSLRTVLHVWAQCMFRNGNKYWKPRYTQYRKAVDRSHPERPKARRMNHALRLIVKDMLKDFWVRVHRTGETDACAPKSAGAGFMLKPKPDVPRRKVQTKSAGAGAIYGSKPNYSVRPPRRRTAAA